MNKFRGTNVWKLKFLYSFQKWEGRWHVPPSPVPYIILGRFDSPASYLLPLSKRRDATPTGETNTDTASKCNCVTWIGCGLSVLLFLLMSECFVRRHVDECFFECGVRFLQAPFTGRHRLQRHLCALANVWLVSASPASYEYLNIFCCGAVLTDRRSDAEHTTEEARAPFARQSCQVPLNTSSLSDIRFNSGSVLLAQSYTLSEFWGYRTREHDNCFKCIIDVHSH